MDRWIDRERERERERELRNLVQTLTLMFNINLTPFHTFANGLIDTRQLDALGGITYTHTHTFSLSLSLSLSNFIHTMIDYSPNLWWCQVSMTDTMECVGNLINWSNQGLRLWKMALPLLLVVDWFIVVKVVKKNLCFFFWSSIQHLPKNVYECAFFFRNCLLIP